MDQSEEAVVTALMNSLSTSVFRTRGGSLAVVFTTQGGGDMPILGAYYAGDRWVVGQWCEDGMFSDVPRKIDLVMQNNDKELA